MYKAQQAIITQLKAGRAASFPTVKAASIKEYAGEAGDAKKLNALLPTILVMHIDSNPAGIEPKYMFDLLICTESEIFEEEESENTNLQLVQQVVDYLNIEANCSWLYNSVPYIVDRDAINARTILQDDRFTIIAVRLEVYNRL